ncbi:hypothetical protein BAE44_0015448 [Dichanthelium oligosanthes]|uniref:Uncharacterized protein n=1 Tax=Dichanthelium oligosanthes TaxID=888268 RepID=A0A1E5VEF4_9POAL|nr:hypothetical protein BAE44_0015448 [Dichanthelium oligosanthes]
MDLSPTCEGRTTAARVVFKSAIAPLVSYAGTEEEHHQYFPCTECPSFIHRAMYGSLQSVRIPASTS